MRSLRNISIYDILPMTVMSLTMQIMMTLLVKFSASDPAHTIPNILD